MAAAPSPQQATASARSHLDGPDPTPPTRRSPNVRLTQLEPHPRDEGHLSARRPSWVRLVRGRASSELGSRCQGSRRGDPDPMRRGRLRRDRKATPAESWHVSGHKRWAASSPRWRILRERVPCAASRLSEAVDRPKDQLRLVPVAQLCHAVDLSLPGCPGTRVGFWYREVGQVSSRP